MNDKGPIIDNNRGLTYSYDPKTFVITVTSADASDIPDQVFGHMAAHFEENVGELGITLERASPSTMKMFRKSGHEEIAIPITQIPKLITSILRYFSETKPIKLDPEEQAVLNLKNGIKEAISAFVSCIKGVDINSDDIQEILGETFREIKTAVTDSRAPDFIFKKLEDSEIKSDTERGFLDVLKEHIKHYVDNSLGQEDDKEFAQIAGAVSGFRKMKEKLEEISRRKARSGGRGDEHLSR